MAKATVRTLEPDRLPAGKVPDLDRLIHERVRLGIVVALALNESLTFTELKERLETTDGNISVHARKLEEAGYVECHKAFEGRVPKSTYTITAEGRAALERHIDHLDAIVQAMRGK